MSTPHFLVVEMEASADKKSGDRTEGGRHAKVSSGGLGVRIRDPLPNLQDEDTEQEPAILLQPETRPISHEQLFLEVKGIYAGLLMVESKCIEVDSRQSKAALEQDPFRPTKLKDEQWQALIALHRTLLHEHHDGLSASFSQSCFEQASRTLLYAG